MYFVTIYTQLSYSQFGPVVQRISLTALLILRQLEVETFRAPYLASPQLIWLYQQVTMGGLCGWVINQLATVQGLVDYIWAGEDSLIYEAVSQLFLASEMVDVNREQWTDAPHHSGDWFWQWFSSVCGWTAIVELLSGKPISHAQLLSEDFQAWFLLVTSWSIHWCMRVIGSASRPELGAA